MHVVYRLFAPVLLYYCHCKTRPPTTYLHALGDMYSLWGPACTGGFLFVTHKFHSCLLAAHRLMYSPRLSPTSRNLCPSSNSASVRQPTSAHILYRTINGVVVAPSPIEFSPLLSAFRAERPSSSSVFPLYLVFVLFSTNFRFVHCDLQVTESA